MQIQSFFQPTDDDFELFVTRWLPDEDVKIKGVICLCHGMMEHIMRYDKIATYFTEQGYIFNAYDQRGHGKTAQNAKEKNKGDFGILSSKHGDERVTKDLHLILTELKKSYPEQKIILLSHSFGSLVTQHYLETYGSSLIEKCILVGTSGPHYDGYFGFILNRIMAPFVNPNKESKFFTKLAFGSYLKRIPKNQIETPEDWLSKSRENVTLYNMDEWCGKVPTFSFYRDLLSLTSKISFSKNIKKIPKDLPLLFLYGQEDPVGAYGKSIQALIRKCKKNGVKSIEYISYPTLRHEIFNENEWETVVKDILNWI